MKLKKNNLITKICLYLIIFSVTILAILWLFQVCFLDTYYEHVKIKDMDKIANKILDYYTKDNFDEILDSISFNRGVCIEIINNTDRVYSQNDISRGCIKENDNLTIQNLKKHFMKSNNSIMSYKIKNPRFNNKILFYGIKYVIILLDWSER